MEPSHLPGVLERVLLSEEQIQARIAELAAQIAEDYAGRPPLLIGVLSDALTPTYGQHAYEVLHDLLGYDEDRIADLAVAEALE